MKQTSFDQIYKNYTAAIYCVICKYIKNREVAQDVLQMAFFKISKHFAGYDDTKGVLFTWMRKIAVNTALDVLKSTDHRQHASYISLDDPDMDLMNFTYEITRSEAIGLNTLLMVLTEKQRTIVDLLYLKQYTQSETSVFLSISIGTVKSQLKIALSKMRKYSNGDIMHYNQKARGGHLIQI